LESWGSWGRESSLEEMQLGISFAGKLLFETLCDRTIAAKQTLEATNI